MAAENPSQQDSQQQQDGNVTRERQRVLTQAAKLNTGKKWCQPRDTKFLFLSIDATKNIQHFVS